MKIIFRIVIILISTALLYTSAMYGYAWIKVRPITPAAPVSELTTARTMPFVHMIHRVNTVNRARAKDKAYIGMEIDLSRVNGKLLVAHDASNFDQAVPLESIFSAVQNPSQKIWWIDLKNSLSQADIDDLLATAAKYHIPTEHLLFETTAGKTAQRLKQNNLLLLLQLPDGISAAIRRPQQHMAYNASLEKLLQQYQPYALTASLGKYPYLKTYFPHYNKAIYSSTIIRPSLKKYFLTRIMCHDPSVVIWMQDEYTAFPF